MTEDNIISFLKRLEINVNAKITFNVKDVTPTPTPTEPVEVSPTPTETPVVSSTPTETPAVTPTPTETPVVSTTPTETPAVTPTPTETPVVSPTPPDKKINIILENDFEHYTLGKWDIDEITTDFWQHDPRITIGGAYNNFVDVVDFDGSRCLRARMPYNANGTLSGFDIYSRLNPDLKLEEVYVSYNLFFPNDFKSAHGGKLPGMTSMGMPGQIYEYNNDPYNPRSGNLVAGLYKGNNGPDEIKWYNFLKFPPDNQSPWGHMSPDGPYWTNTFGNGAWHNVTLRMVHSEASKYDGLCEVFIDGVLSDTWGDICTRIESNQVWDDLRFQLFTNDSSEQTDTTNYYAYIDDLLLFNYDGNTDPNIPKGRVVSNPGRILDLPNWPKSGDTGVNILFKQDFSESPLTTAYRGSDVQRDFGNWKWSNGIGWKDIYNVSIINENNNRLMKVKTWANQISPDYGVQFAKIFSGNELQEDVWFSYNTIFKPYFIPVQGGKLPGLSGGDYSGGGTHPTNGFSARLMFKQDCSLDFYLYWPEMPGEWGSHFGRFPDPKDLSKQFSFYHDTEVWHNITTRVKLNSTGNHDGFLEAYLDGICVKRVDGLLLRLDDTVKSDLFNITHFFGGNTMDWAPPEDQWIKIDDVLLFISENDVGKPIEVGRDISNLLPNWPKF